MLSSASRTLTRLSAIGYLLIGTVLFLAPDWASGQFPWNVSSFVVMTIGGWGRVPLLPSVIQEVAVL